VEENLKLFLLELRRVLENIAAKSVFMVRKLKEFVDFAENNLRKHNL
jgi:hypothetical protein